jgi:hypothetical protein
VFFNAEIAENAENGIDRGTTDSWFKGLVVVTLSFLCGLCALCVERSL